jgi:short-subunit dehydrogenase
MVTGASTRIGYELAKRCAAEGFDLILAADEPAIRQAAEDCRQLPEDCRQLNVPGGLGGS